MGLYITRKIHAQLAHASGKNPGRVVERFKQKIVINVDGLEIDVVILLTVNRTWRRHYRVWDKSNEAAVRRHLVLLPANHCCCLGTRYYVRRTS